MNNAPSELKEQIDNILEWHQNRCDALVAQKNYEDMYALYMEWHEWIEEEDPSIMVLGEWDDPD